MKSDAGFALSGHVTTLKVIFASTFVLAAQAPKAV